MNLGWKLVGYKQSLLQEQSLIQQLSLGEMTVPDFTNDYKTDLENELRLGERDKKTAFAPLAERDGKLSPQLVKTKQC